MDVAAAAEGDSVAVVASEVVQFRLPLASLWFDTTPVGQVVGQVVGLEEEEWVMAETAGASKASSGGTRASHTPRGKLRIPNLA